MFGWFDHLLKAHLSDIFVVMVHCQYEKNGFQNRVNLFGNWWTMPVFQGKELIKDKVYTTDQSLQMVNMQWILAIFMTLGIDTKKIRFDFPTDKTGTERIIEICKKYDGDQYLTNPEAVIKYLDEKLMNDNGIEVVPVKSQHKKHVFEMFNESGIESVIKTLNKEKELCLR